MSSLLVTQGLGTSAVTLLILSATMTSPTNVDVAFSGNVFLNSHALDPTNWSIATSPSVTNVVVDGTIVHLTVTPHDAGSSYIVTAPTGITNGDGQDLSSPFTASYTGVGSVVVLNSVRGVDIRTVDIVFNLPVVKSQALDPANYAITGPSPVQVLSVAYQTDHDFRLTTTAQLLSSAYTITVSNVQAS
ncbi:hypothetical protein UFOVP75_144 [uncultured Caudovirales phage]|uniref:Uncharacterized protein n=1 Tax=uncultured Caudovirales phage TaxID=2100421 RepID=A0A6J5L2A7_9CAUD|nr:hypothetical protein UFOVP75_144 [uncultured Caudovirales phage]